MLTCEPHGPILGDMTGRPRQFDKCTALCAAMELFWKRGYTATSLDDLLGVMSLSKSSFYAEFKSKESLYSECLKHYQEMIAQHLSNVRKMSNSTRGFFEAIFAEAVADADTGDPKGCFIVNSAIEFGQHDSRFTDDVWCALTEVQRGFEAVLQQGIRKGELSIPDSPKVMAKYITTCLSGLRAMIKGGMPPKDAKTVVKTILASLE